MNFSGSSFQQVLLKHGYIVKCSIGGTYRHSVEFETLELCSAANGRAVVSWEEELKDQKQEDKNGLMEQQLYL